MIKIRVPATTANLGPGFDSIGLALKLYNYLTVSECEEDLVIETTGRAKNIPLGEANLIYKTIQRFCEETGRPLKTGVKLCQDDFIPMTRGLGSSAACIVAGLLAGNELTGGKSMRKELVDIAAMIEGHPDNSTPAFTGGIAVGAMTGKRLDYICLHPPILSSLRFAAMIPCFTLQTEHARQVLKAEYSREDAIFNASRAALLVAALMKGDLKSLRTAMDDRIHQPYRMSLIPGMEEIFAESIKLGAKGVFLSGAGPTLIAVVMKRDVDHFRNKMERFLHLSRFRAASDDEMPIEDCTDKQVWKLRFFEAEMEGAKVL